MDNDKKEETCKPFSKGTCGCWMGLIMLLIFLTGGIIGYLIGQNYSCAKTWKTCLSKPAAASSHVCTSCLKK